MRLSVGDRSAITGRAEPLARALLLHDDLVQFAYREADYPAFPQNVLSQIREGIPDFVQTRALQSSRFKLFSLPEMMSTLSTESDPVERDRLVWESLDRSSTLRPKRFESAFNNAASTKERVSAMLAMHHSAHKDFDSVVGFFEDQSEGSDVEIAEWARMFLLEMVATATNNLARLEESVSTRDFVYLKDQRFDLTMPLLFSGVAYTKIGGVTKKNCSITP